MTVNGRTTLVASTILSSSSTALNSLQGVDTTSLEEGASCFVKENDGEYVLYPLDTQTPDNFNIVAATGGGNWLLQSIGGGIDIDITEEVPGLILLQANLRDAVIQRASSSPKFDNWTPSAGATITGTEDPWTLESNNPAADSFAGYTVDNLALNTLVLHEAVLEAGTADFGVLSTSGGSTDRVWFNLATGTIGTTGGVTLVDQTIEEYPVGSGRYLCRILSEGLGIDYEIYVTDADGSLNSALGSNIIVHEVQTRQVRCETLTNRPVPTEPAEQATATEQGIFLDYDVTDPANSVWETNNGLVFLAGAAPYHALEMDGLASNFGGTGIPVAVYVYAKQLTDSGATDHTMFSAVATGTQYIRFGFNDADVFLARSGLGGPEVRVTEAAAGLDTWALYAGYYDGDDLVVAVDDTLGTPTAFPFEESQLNPVAVNFGGESYGGVPVNQSEAQILLWAVVVSPRESPVVFGDATDLLIRGKIAAIVEALGL